MTKDKLHFNYNKNLLRLISHLRLICFLLALFSAFVTLNFVSAQETTEIVETIQQQPAFRIGEKLTYNISFEKFENAGYAEIFVVSTGKLVDKNAVELRSKIRTDDFVSAAFYLIDEMRTTFAGAETGLPLFVKKTNLETGLPEETISNFLVEPTMDFDLLTLIYRVRNVGGIGNFTIRESGKTYNISFQNTVSESIETPAGNFETSVSTVQSDYFTEKGITNLRINFSIDEARIPALIRFKTDKGEFQLKLASLQVLNNQNPNMPTPTPSVVPTPVRTPTPIPTPKPYLENQTLSPDLAFVLGETLEYRVTNLTQPIGTLTLQAKERKLFQNQDSLLLTATVTKVEPGNQLFYLNDGINAQVNPNTLAPKFIEIKFNGLLSSINQTASFNQEAGTATFNNKPPLEIPVGTHSLLSLAYAIRSFNLKPSADPTNPVNDTRVAVFLDGKPYVFTLRPSNAEIINFKEEKISAQLITIKTGEPGYDRLNLRLWLSTDEKRVPLRFSAGNYQADLISQKISLPK
jgi:hypothetical protein